MWTLLRNAINSGEIRNWCQLVPVGASLAVPPWLSTPELLGMPSLSFIYRHLHVHYSWKIVVVWAIRVINVHVQLVPY